MGFFKSTAEKEEKRELKQKKKEQTSSFSCKSLQPLGKIAVGDMVFLTLNPEESVLIIRSGVNAITLPYQRIRGFKLEKEIEVAESGSAIGRAIVGGVLFGGAGAIVGASSAKGNTNNTWIGTLLYEDKDGGLQELLFLQIGLASPYSGKDKHLGGMQFENSVNRIASRCTEAITEL